MYRGRNVAAIVRFSVVRVPAYEASRKPADKTDGSRKLDHDVGQILSDPAVARGLWGIYVVSLDNGVPLYALNQDKLFTPASNAKLFTTAAVFGLIGPDYRFKTTVETS